MNPDMTTDWKRASTDWFHVLNFLGPWWGASPPRFPVELAAGYTRYVVEHDGVVTWDVPVGKTGQIPAAFVKQLAAIGQAAKIR